MKEVKFCYVKKLSLKYINGVDNLLQKELTSKEKKYFPYTKQDIITQLSNVNDYFYVVVDQDEEVLGYGHAGTFDGKYKIPVLEIAISKFCRKIGIGELLCKYMIKDMKKKGYEKIIVKINIQNVKAQRLFGDLDFKRYRKNKEFIWMQKDLSI